MTTKNTSVRFPRKLLRPIGDFLALQLKKLERTQKKVAKEDPYDDLERNIQTAAPDAEAEEQVTHLRSVALQAQLTRKIIQTRRALTRVRIGTYGICDNCKQMIDTDRLMVYPEATLCVNCERKLEKKKART